MIKRCSLCRKNVSSVSLETCCVCEEQLCRDCLVTCIVCEESLCHSCCYYCVSCEEPVCPDCAIVDGDEDRPDVFCDECHEEIEYQQSRSLNKRFVHKT